ncbi:hypothetical protein N7931_07980 [Catenovulum sp. 2E275]|uniref:hypothetical protein n=1 Tax=Catenovulum sp. 2E275 TaxID=2980497 RepID=UPI0021D084B6|nr:hypothetical protein [Catenovulum sp. 2E275]MCU4675574.1 hypothetical protein [Catenovulum sp. 2E275]
MMFNRSVEKKPEQAQYNPRRSFLKKGVVGTALITTISSKSAWATNCSCSGNLSNNTSSQKAPEVCGSVTGYSHGTWKGNGQSRKVGPIFNAGSYYQWDSVTIAEIFTNNLDRNGSVLLVSVNTTDLVTYGLKSSAHNMKVKDFLNLSGSDLKAHIDKDKASPGDWRQRVNAAMNATLWAILVAYTADDSVNTWEWCKKVEADFYYPLSLSYIVSASEFELDASL